VLVREWLDNEFYHRYYKDDDPNCADVDSWDLFRKQLRNQLPRGLGECAAGGSELWNTINNVGRGQS